MGSHFKRSNDQGPGSLRCTSPSAQQWSAGGGLAGRAASAPADLPPTRRRLLGSGAHCPAPSGCLKTECPSSCLPPGWLQGIICLPDALVTMLLAPAPGTRRGLPCPALGRERWRLRHLLQRSGDAGPSAPAKSIQLCASDSTVRIPPVRLRCRIASQQACTTLSTCTCRLPVGSAAAAERGDVAAKLSDNSASVEGGPQPPEPSNRALRQRAGIAPLSGAALLPPTLRLPQLCACMRAARGFIARRCIAPAPCIAPELAGHTGPQDCSATGEPQVPAAACALPNLCSGPRSLSATTDAAASERLQRTAGLPCSVSRLSRLGDSHQVRRVQRSWRRTPGCRGGLPPCAAAAACKTPTAALHPAPPHAAPAAE